MKRRSDAQRDLTEILEILRKHLPELRKRYGVQTLGVFGSYVRGEQRGRSDLDVLVDFGDKPVTLFDFVALEQEVSRLVGVSVDLVERQALKPGIGRSILEQVVTLGNASIGAT